MLREARVPPDAGVEKFRQVLTLLVGAGLAFCPVHVCEFWMRIECIGAFVFPGVVINASGFFCWTARAAAFAVKHVNDVILGARHLRLCEEGKQVLVSAMAVDDDHLFASVAR